MKIALASLVLLISSAMVAAQTGVPLGTDRVLPSGIADPEIAADGRGLVLAIYRRLGSLRPAVSRSVDGGETWSSPIDVATSTAENTAIATDRVGTWVVCWTPGNGADVHASRSIDGGFTWSPPTVVHVGPGTADTSLVWDGAGSFVLAFTASSGVLDTDIRVARSADGLTWSAAGFLAPSMNNDVFFDFYPSLAATADGRIMAAWYDGSNGGLRSTTSCDGGATWTSPVLVFGFAVTGVAVATDGDDFVIVCSSAFFLPFIGSLTSEDFGVTWSTPVSIESTPVDTASQMHLVADGAGNWLACWAAREPGPFVDLDVRVSRSEDAGATWTAPESLNVDHASDVHPDAPGLPVALGTGVFLVPYTDADGFDARVRTVNLCPLLDGGAPGTGEDFVLATAVNGLGCPFAAIKPARPGDLVGLAYGSPAGTFDGRAGALLVQATLAGDLPPSPFPGIAVNPAIAPGVAVFLDGVLVAPGGTASSFIMPAGLDGIDLLLQAFALTSTASNGIFASTPAHAVRGS